MARKAFIATKVDDDEARARSARIRGLLEAAGFSVFLPVKRDGATAVEILETNEREAAAADVVVGIFDRAGAGGGMELGRAHALGKPIIGYRTPESVSDEYLGKMLEGFWARLPPDRKATDDETLRNILERLDTSASVDRPKVGTSVLIVKDGKVLLGRRMNAHGDGHYAFPGGHLEHLESILDCVKREAAEETGLEIGNLRFLRVYNLKGYAPKHYVDVGVIADWVSGEPQVLEPEKCMGWEWYDPDALPSPRFDGVDQAIEAWKTGRSFFDA